MKKLFGLYVITFVIFSFFVLFLFRLSIFNFQSTLFFKGIIILMMSFVLTSLSFIALRKKFSIVLHVFISALIMSFSLHFVFFVIFPVTFDRSVTMYILNSLYQQSSMSKTDLEESLINEYIVVNKALDKRLFEQKQTGFVTERENRVELTDQGRLFMYVSFFIKRLYRLP